MPRAWPVVVAGAAAALLAACPTLNLEPNQYRCDRRAGDVLADGTRQCPGETWHCGVQGYCYDRVTAGAIACEHGADDCAPGWRCGIDNLCRKAEPGAHACAVDGGFPAALADAGLTADSFCEGWTCGIDGRCHPAEPGPWPCTEDPHCFGWRCGLDGQCVDPAPEAIDFSSFQAIGSTHVENPELFPPAINGLAAGAPFHQYGEGYVDSVRSLYWTSSNGGDDYTLTHVLTARRRNLQTGELEGVYVLPAQHPFNGAPVGVAGSAAAAFLLRGAPGQRTLSRFSELPDGGFGEKLEVPTQADSLRTISDFAVPGVLAWVDHGETATYLFDDGLVPTRELAVPIAKRAPPKGKGSVPPVFLDAMPLRKSFGAGLVLATSRALHWVDTNLLFGNLEMSQAEPGTPNWCELPDSANGVLFRYEAQDLFERGNFDVELRGRAPARFLEPALLAVKVREISQGNFGGLTAPTQDAFYVLSSNEPPADATCGEGVPQRIVLGPCSDPCASQDPNYQTIDFAPLHAASQFDEGRLEVRCGRPNSSSIQFSLVTSVGFGDVPCISQPLFPHPMTEDPVIAMPHAGGAAWVGAHGQIWAGPSPSEAVPITLDTPPLALVGHPDGGSPFGVLEQGLTYHQPGAGWLSSTDAIPESERVIGVASGADWLVLKGGYVADPTPEPLPDGGFNTIVAYAEQPLEEPVRAVVSERSDGGSHLVVSSGDRIFSATLEPPYVEPARLTLRLVPASQSNVIALAPAAPEPGTTALSTTWVAAQQQVWRLDSVTDKKWTVTPVEIPEGDLQEVWSDPAGRARLGYRDGTVVSLPSGLVLAPPNLEITAVEDYLDVCGQPWLLATEGLYRLVKDGDATVGRWQWLDIPESPSEYGYWGSGSRLFHDRNSVYVFGAYGSVARVETECTAGGAP